MTTKKTEDTSASDDSRSSGQAWPKTERSDGTSEQPTLSVANGPEQTPVFVTGSGGFGTDPGKILFNEVPGAIATWTDTGILTAVPYGATTGDVTIQTADGRRIAVAAFTVDPGVWTEQGVQGTLPKE